MKVNKLLSVFLSLSIILVGFPRYNGVAAEYNPNVESPKYEFNDHTYQIFDISMERDKANEFCESLGGHLVTITSAEEQVYVSSLISNGAMNSYWIGLKYISYGSYQWANEEDFLWNNLSSGSLGNSSQPYFQLLKDGSWNDHDNVIRGSFWDYTYTGIICEWDDIETSENDTNIDYRLELEHISETDTSASLKWSVAESGTISYYTVLNGSEIVADNIQGFEYTVTGLSGANTYQFQVVGKNENGDTLCLSDTISVTTDLVIKSDTAIFSDTTVSDLYIDNGTFNLNGYHLNVEGSVYLKSGKLSINGGSLFVNGNLSLIFGYYYYPYLIMTNSSDYILVKGNFIDNSYKSHSGYLTAGTLEVRGNFTQKNGSETNFNATGTHKVILSGTQKQIVNFDSLSSKFSVLEIQNYSDDGVYFSTPLNADSLFDNGCNITFKNGERFGWKLTGDQIFEGDLYIGAGTLDLNGFKLTVNGNLIQSAGTVNINGGNLDVTGDYKIQTVSGTNSSGILKMTNQADYVKVGGEFITQSAIDHSSYLTAGTLEVKGNLTQLSGNNKNFRASGTHKVLLSGDIKQTVSFANTYYNDRSCINIFEITNTSAEGVDIAKSVYVNKELESTETPVTNGKNLILNSTAVLTDNVWNADLSVYGGKLLNNTEIGGSLYVSSGLDLNGYTLNVKGNVFISGSTLNINGGKLLVDGNLTLAYSSTYSNNPILIMSNPSDYVLVKGNIIDNSRGDHNGYLTAGVLEIKGNFSQSYTSGDCFYATGTHKVILSGTQKQIVNFDSLSSKFSVLEIQNYSDDGVYFSTPLNADSLFDNGCNITFKNGERFGWKLTGDQIFEGDLYIGAGTLDLNGFKLTVNGNLIQSAGTVNINGGNLDVTGDYKIQTVSGTNSSGILKMTNQADYVKVGGEFITQSAIDHSSYLTAGTLEVKGNLTQLSGNNKNFRASGTHKVLLSGDIKQTVSFANTYYNDRSCINIFEITNTSAEGVDIAKSVYVNKELESTETPVTNGKNLILNSTAVLTDNVWNADLSVYGGKLLNNTEIGGSLYVSSGLDLNGYTLNVKGNVFISGSTININGGKLFIDGNLELQNSSYPYAKLKMTNPSDYVLVKGNFINGSSDSHSGYLTAGTLEVKGDFTQKSGDNYNFYATGTHKVVLSGDEKQTVSFASEYSKFSVLDIQNYSDDGVYFTSALNAGSIIDNGCNITFKNGSRFGWKLTEDQVFEGDLYIGAGVLDLNGFKLTVNGNLIQSAGTVNINGGNLDVTGDYKIQTVSGTNSSGILKMTNQADYVKVGGEFITQSAIDHSSYLTAGTLEVKGNLTQLSGNNKNFRASGTHKVLLSGDIKQTVSFANTYYNDRSCINIFEITNTSAEGVDIAKSVYVNKELESTETPVTNGKNLILNSTAVLTDNVWNADLSVYGGKLLNNTEIGGSLYVSSGLDLNGYTLNVKGNVFISGSTININGGKLFIDGNLELQNSSYPYAKLKMTNPSDYVLVKGNFINGSSDSHSGYLTAGTLEVKGDFTQKSGNSYNFYATGTHKVVLSGDEKQTVSFDSEYSRFSVLDIQNYSDDGVYFTSALNASSVFDNGCNISFLDGSRFGWKLTEDQVFEGDLYIGAGVLDLNGFKLTVNGNLIQSAGTVNINGGNLDVTGDYKIQTVSGTNSSGILKMTNQADYVKVGGEFITQSAIDHSSYLTAGTLEVKGNLTQLSGNNKNFRASGTHKVLLSGDIKQTVSFANTYYNDRSCINIFEITNTSAEGVDIAKSVYVNKELESTETPVTNGKNLILNSTAVLTDNVWNADLSVYGGKLLNNTEIGGSLYVTNNQVNYDFDLNGKTLSVSNNLVLERGAIYVNGGKLLIRKNFRIQNSGTASDGTETYSQSYGRLKMVNPNDYVKVEGDFIQYSCYSHNGYLTAGTLEVRGDFTQIKHTNEASDNFLASGTHKVILSGSKKQTVYFQNSESKINVLEITKPLDSGYSFSRTPLWNELIERPADTSAPTAPSELKCIHSTATSIVLEWNEGTDNYGVDGYYVYRNGVVVGSTGSTKYIDSGLLPATTYSYYLISYDIERNLSPKSDAIEARTAVDANAPTTPKNLRISNTSGITILTWTGSSDNSKVEGYKIYRNGEAIKFVNGTSYTESSELDDGVYEYYIVAVDDTGNLSQNSETVVYDKMPPESPVLSLSSLTDTSIKLSWYANDNIGITGYNLYKNGNRIVSSSASGYIDNDIDSGELYEYYVEAYDAVGNISQASNVLSVFTGEDTTAPSITSFSSVKKYVCDEAEIKIVATDNAGVASVKIQYSIDKVNWEDISEAALSGRTTETKNVKFSLESFKDGSVYFRAIVTDKSENVSDLKTCPIIEIVVDKTAPCIPQNIKSEINSGKINVTWDLPGNEDMSHFKLYRSIGDSSDFILIKDNYRYLNYIESDINLATKYSYKITAVDIAGNESEATDIVSAILENDSIAPSVLSYLPSADTVLHRNIKFSISCMDNFKLKQIMVEYSLKNQNEWKTAFSTNLSTYSCVVDFDLNSDEMISGEYEFRVTLLDTSGNQCQKNMGIYSFEEGDLSVPVVTATPGGWQANLSWTANTSEKISHYLVYRKTTANGEYECIQKTSATGFTDEMLSPDKAYYYMVKAVDIYGNSKLSDFVFVVPTNEDNYAPEAYAGEDLLSLNNTVINFDGTLSYDNIGVSSYFWNFGDGNYSTSSKPKHSYSQEGTYIVELTVKDSYGNSDTDTMQVEILGSEYSSLTVCVTDLNGAPLSNAMIYYEVSNSPYKLGTNSSGKSQLILSSGKHEIFVYKENYLPVSKEITVSENQQTIVIALEKKELVSAEWEVNPLELNEIIALGVDINAPENQFVYKYTFRIYYNNDENWVIYQNSSGEIISGSTTFKKDGRVVTLQPYMWGNVPFLAVVEIDTTVSWLKEFFAVNLTLINNASEEFSIINSSATLNIPDGLSLASINKNQQPTQYIGTINGQEQKTVSWIIRGDKAGEYNLSADFCGVLMPFGLDVNARFSTSEPLVVHGGKALQFDVVHDIWGITGDYWDTTFTLTNISDRDLYNVTASIGGFAELFEVTDMKLVYPDGTIIVVPWKNGKPDEENEEIFLPALYERGCDNFMTLKPGEAITGVYSIKPTI